jgi:hypothetical protein
VKIFITVCLVSNGPKHTISISAYLYNLQTFRCQFIFKSSFLSSPINGWVVKWSLLFRMELNAPCTAVYLSRRLVLV